MSKRVAVALAVLSLAAIGAFAGATPASAIDTCPDCWVAPGGSTSPLAPTEASTLSTTGASSGVSATTVVAGSTALAAASTPGANTSVESDLSLDQAVGIDALPTSSTDTTSTTGTSTGRAVCWSSEAWGRWGTWPYDQKLIDTTYWCAKYGVKITYRTSSVTGGGTLCGLDWRASQLIAGGVGYPSFTMRSSGGFSCATAIPWIVLHPSHHIDVRRTDVGTASIVGSG